jgi:hypothetical protein
MSRVRKPLSKVEGSFGELEAKQHDLRICLAIHGKRMEYADGYGG